MAPGSKETSFHGCYLLCATCARSKGRTYIGYTVNPGRRIKQHNSGTQHGGAKRTSGREWDMVLIVYGFPTNIYALQFEWAWQHPRESLRLRQDVAIQRLPRKGRSLPHCWTVVCHLLRTGPWCRLPLHIRWLCPQYQLEFAADARAPGHMTVSCGSMDIMSCNPLYSHFSEECAEEAVEHLKQLDTVLCAVCAQVLSSDSLWSQCYSPACTATYHLVCLARLWLQHGRGGHGNPGSIASSTSISSQRAVAASTSVTVATMPSQPALSQRQALRQRLTRPKAAASSQQQQQHPLSSLNHPATAVTALSSSQHVLASSQSLSATQRQRQRQQPPSSLPPSSPCSRHLVPIEGECPTCGTRLQWGALVTWRKRLVDLWDKPAKAAKPPKASKASSSRRLKRPAAS